MANNFATTNWISMKVLWFLKNSCEIASMFNNGWQEDFEKGFPVGSSIQIPLPQSWLVTSGLAYQEQGINNMMTTLTIDQTKGIHFGWDQLERMLKLNRSEKEIEEKFLRPAGAQLAQQVDSDAANWAATWTNNVVGTLGTDSTTIDFALAADQTLFTLACPAEGTRHLCMTPSLMRSYVKNNVTQFNPAPEISRMFRKGVMGTAAGFEWYRSNSLVSHTCGTAPTGGVTVVGAGQSGAALTVTGSAGQTINPGDKFSIAAVNAVNPRTRIRTSLGLKQFVYAGGAPWVLTGGNDVIPISPAIFGPGSQYQNVDALPANAAAFTFWPGTTTPSGLTGTISLAMSPYAFSIAYGKYENPEAVERAEQAVDPDTGARIAFVRAWDQYNYKMTNRYDMAYGFGNNYPELCIAIAGA
ncbi:P22 phage major capsid protein family protein [Acidicapsa dinghuensis]|uniref:P22 phage major capsid protein family protein n=1 Tax=Acidicapsa dinghuensis TaxID=2218256 RepID=A0ABW1ECV1_9BACT|nr:P22 phage major capsid protein family protein [Acidicapsa dinghuensis]